MIYMCVLDSLKIMGVQTTLEQFSPPLSSIGNAPAWRVPPKLLAVAVADGIHTIQPQNKYKSPQQQQQQRQGKQLENE